MKVLFLFLSCVIAVLSITNPVFADAPQIVTVQATVKNIEADKITVEVNEGVMKGKALEAQSNPSASADLEGKAAKRRRLPNLQIRQAPETRLFGIFRPAADSLKRSSSRQFLP